MDVFWCVLREKCGFGVVMLCKKFFFIKFNFLKCFRSFEYIDIVIKFSFKIFRFVVVYWLLFLKKNGFISELFFEDFGLIFKYLVIEKG